MLYSCKFCSRVSLRFDVIEDHEIRRHGVSVGVKEPLNNVYICEHCGEKFNIEDKERIDRHLEECCR